MVRKFFYGLLALLPLLIIISACEMVLPEARGLIEFTDFADQQTFIGGNAGLMDFEGKTVELGARKVLPLNIKNSGEGPLVIKNIHILQTAVPDNNPADALDAFTFVEGTFPALPLAIPPGQTVNDIFIEFAPETAGDFRGKLFVETDSGSSFIDLAGTGLWQLKVNGDADGILYILADNPADNVVIDGAGASGTAIASDGVFNLLCETVFLREFDTWQESGTSQPADLEFANARAVKTTVTLNTHAEIEANILNPYVYVQTSSPLGEDEYTNLQDAIAYCFEQADKTAVVVSEGTYVISGNIVFSETIPIYGGYRCSPD